MKTTDQMIKETYQAVVGIPENPCDNGLLGKCTEMEEHLKELNGQVKKNTTFRIIGTWISCALIAGIITILVNVVTQ
jgi:hypothetical protein